MSLSMFWCHNAYVQNRFCNTGITTTLQQEKHPNCATLQRHRIDASKWRLENNILQRRIIRIQSKYSTLKDLLRGVWRYIPEHFTRLLMVAKMLLYLSAMEQRAAGSRLNSRRSKPLWSAASCTSRWCNEGPAALIWSSTFDQQQDTRICSSGTKQLLYADQRRQYNSYSCITAAAPHWETCQWSAMNNTKIPDAMPAEPNTAAAE